MGAKQLSKCKTLNCEFNINGRCRTLRDTDFKNKSCSFFKEAPQDTTEDDLSKVTVKTN